MTPPSGEHPAAQQPGHTGHGWMTIAYSIPMLIIATMLIAPGSSVSVGCSVR
jgi:hypothetical protein